MCARAQGAGTVRSRDDDRATADVRGGEFARRIAKVEIDVPGKVRPDTQAIAFARAHGVGLVHEPGELWVYQVRDVLLSLTSSILMSRHYQGDILTSREIS